MFQAGNSLPNQGCFAYGADGERALAGIPQAIQAYGGERWLPGGPVAFEVESPHECELRLLRNGAEMARTEGRTLKGTDERPGVYRVEARIEGKPWVFTNHIYVRGPGSQAARVSGDRVGEKPSSDSLFAT